MMLTSTVNTIKHQEITSVYYVQSDNNKRNYFQDTVTDTFYGIVFKFVYNDKNSLTDTSNFKLLAKHMKNYFSPGLIVNVKFGNVINYLELKNSKISEEKLFDEYWDFRENVWFNLPKALTRNRHLAMG